MAASFISQAPAGQINDVFSGSSTRTVARVLVDCLADIRTIIDDDFALEQGIQPALERYNLEQLSVAQLPQSPLPVVVCSASQLPGRPELFVDPRSKQVFQFDHMQMTASIVEPLPIDDALEAIRAPLEESITAYVQNHFSQGVASVFATDGPVPSTSTAPASQVAPDAEEERKQPEEQEKPVERLEETDQAAQPEQVEETKPTEEDPVNEREARLESAEASEEPANPPEPEDAPRDVSMPPASPQATEPVEDALPRAKKFSIAFVGNKYNTANFWTGRWRSSYELDCESGSLNGTVLAQVHYYEQGNVQLNTAYPISVNAQFDASNPSALAKEVTKLIASHEKDYQNAINQTYLDLSEKTFKSLRRALPITKQKLDWNRITSYKISTELKQA